MKALVYTGVEELSYREEKNPIEKNGESIKALPKLFMNFLFFIILNLQNFNSM